MAQNSIWTMEQIEALKGSPQGVSRLMEPTSADVEVGRFHFGPCVTVTLIDPSILDGVEVRGSLERRPDPSDTDDRHEEFFDWATQWVAAAPRGLQAYCDLDDEPVLVATDDDRELYLLVAAGG